MKLGVVLAAEAWYGGGGTCNGSGGGGGSSYSDSTIFSNVIHSRGVRSDRGLLVISYRNGVECNTTSTRVSVTVTVSTTPTISAGANFKSCPGHTISLTGTGAGAGVTYTWMPGEFIRYIYKCFPNRDYHVYCDGNNISGL